MNVGEQRYLETVPHYLREIAEQLKKANQLKALELKGRHLELSITPEQVDDIMEGND